MNNLVSPSKLEVGNVIKYRTGKFKYLIHKIKPCKAYGTKIVLVRIDEQEGIKKYFRDPKYDFIHEINKEGKRGGYWEQEVKLLKTNHYLPKEGEIVTVTNGKREI